MLHTAWAIIHNVKSTRTTGRMISEIKGTLDFDSI